MFHVSTLCEYQKRWPFNHQFVFLTFYTLINKSSKYKTFLNIWHRCDIIEMGKKVKDGQRYFYAD